MTAVCRGLICVALAFAGAACTSEESDPPGGGDTEAAEAGTSAASVSEDDDGPAGSEDDPGADTGDETPESSGSSDGGPDTGEETSGDPATGTTGDPATASEGGTGDSAGGPTGLEAFCERYFECGGTYYSDVEDCIDASTGYWGTCPAVLAALDAFGDCMITIPCDEYNPDAYNPANTICADEWSDLMQTDC